MKLTIKMSLLYSIQSKLLTSYAQVTLAGSFQKCFDILREFALLSFQEELLSFLVRLFPGLHY